MNIEPTTTNIEQLFSSSQNGDLTFNDKIVSQLDGQRQYFGGSLWSGGLEEIDSTQMYMTKISRSFTMQITGTPVTLPHTKTFAAGWTWISHPYDSDIPINSVLTNLDFEWRTEDKIVSQTEGQIQYFGTDSSGQEIWSGSLTHMKAGKGYMVKTSSGGPAIYSSM